MMRETPPVVPEGTEPDAMGHDAMGPDTAPAGRVATVGQSHQCLMIGLLLFCALVASIGFRIANLVLPVDAKGQSAKSEIDMFLPARADIVDRNGIELARTVEAYAISVRPHKIVGDKRELAGNIATAIGDLDEKWVLSQLTSASPFRYLARRVLPSQARAILTLGEPGLFITREPERLYPNIKLAAHILGHTNVDGQGGSGIERALNDRMKAHDQRGQAVVLSIDGRVQLAMETELAQAMKVFGAKGGAGIILDSTNGEILAMASLPAFNPNDVNASSKEARFNRATLGVYELGSTFKPLTIAMAMDSGIVTDYAQKWDCSAPIAIGRRFTINDTHPFNRKATVPEILKESSNIGTAHIAAKIGPARQREFLQRLGLLDRIGVELPERGTPLSPRKNWGPVETMTIGYGHGIAVTPLHLAAAYATLINGGIWRTPTLLRRNPQNPLEAGRRVFSTETSARMPALLRLAVTDGTGGKADAPGYRVAGKTGSAEKARGGGYARKSLITNFAGFFPADAPRYVLIVMLDEPHGTKKTHGFITAGWNAAPTAGRIISRVAPLLNVAPSSSKDVNWAALLAYVQEEDKV